MNGKKPEIKFVAGSVSATVWNNTTLKNEKQVEYKTISFDRRNKDKDGNWQSTNSLRLNDLPKAVSVLRRAYEYLVVREFTNTNSDIDLNEVEIDETI